MSQFPALIWAIWVNEQMSVERILSPEFSAGRSTADWAWGRALGMLRFPPLSLPWRTRPVWRWPARPVTSQYRCLSIVYTVQYNYFHNLCYCSLISNVNVLYVNFFFICEKYKIKLISVPSKASTGCIHCRLKSQNLQLLLTSVHLFIILDLKGSLLCTSRGESNSPRFYDYRVRQVIFHFSVLFPVIFCHYLVLRISLCIGDATK